MIIASQIVDLASRIGGPRFAHRIYLKRLARWRKLEAEYDLLDRLVEGHELAVLEGATRILITDRPALLIESERRYQADAPESVFRFLTDLNYSGFFLKQNRLNALSAFRRDADQAVENVGKPATDKQPYINNFIFLPG